MQLLNVNTTKIESVMTHMYFNEINRKCQSIANYYNMNELEPKKKLCDKKVKNSIISNKLNIMIRNSMLNVVLIDTKLNNTMTA